MNYNLSNLTPSIIICVVGISVLVWGSVATWRLHPSWILFDANYILGPILLIVSGFLIIVVSIIEAFVLCEKKILSNCCLFLFVLTLSGLLFGAGLAGSISLYHLNQVNQDYLKHQLDFYDPRNTLFTKAVDSMQETWKCCGFNNYTDWSITKWAAANANYTVPTSCCSTKEQHCGANITGDDTAVYTQGCYWPMTAHIYNVLVSVICGGFVFFVFMSSCQCGVYITLTRQRHVGR